MGVSLSHLGICVTDLDRSRRFYGNALGFVPTAAAKAGNESARFMGIDGELSMNTQFMLKDGMLIELLEFEAPKAVGAGELRQMNRTGLTHLNFRVTDLEATVATIVANGGSVLAETRMTADLGDGHTSQALFCTDPDGTRIELMALPDFIRFDTAATIDIAR